MRDSLQQCGDVRQACVNLQFYALDATPSGVGGKKSAKHQPASIQTQNASTTAQAVPRTTAKRGGGGRGKKRFGIGAGTSSEQVSQTDGSQLDPSQSTGAVGGGSSSSTFSAAIGKAKAKCKSLSGIFFPTINEEQTSNTGELPVGQQNPLGQPHSLLSSSTSSAAVVVDPSGIGHSTDDPNPDSALEARTQRLDSLHFFHALGRVLYCKRCEPRARPEILLQEFTTWKEAETKMFWEKYRKQESNRNTTTSSSRSMMGKNRNSAYNSGRHAQDQDFPSSRSGKPLVKIEQEQRVQQAPISSSKRPPNAKGAAMKDDIIDLLSDSEPEGTAVGGPALKKPRLMETGADENVVVVLDRLVDHEHDNIRRINVVDQNNSNTNTNDPIVTLPRPPLHKEYEQKRGNKKSQHKLIEDNARQVFPHEYTVQQTDMILTSLTTSREQICKSIRPPLYFDLPQLIEVQEPRMFSHFLFTNAPKFMSDINDASAFLDTVCNVSAHANRGRYNFWDGNDLELCCRGYLDANVHSCKPGGLYQFRRSRIADVDRAIQRSRAEMHWESAELSSRGMAEGAEASLDYGHFETFCAVDQILRNTCGRIPALPVPALHRITQLAEKFRDEEFSFDPKAEGTRDRGGEKIDGNKHTVNSSTLSIRQRKPGDVEALDSQNLIKKVEKGRVRLIHDDIEDGDSDD
ncbi:unnamed protein product [Amoebophrya sp. A25]|nr:unnamed protein product [Amoebophrya sp. A25]|eukprot:GSA25T00023460001.1